MQLDLTVRAAGVRHIALDATDSTNSEALRRAREGENGPFWITARSQSDGRGRRGRCWISSPGNLYATLLLSDPSPPEVAPQLSFVAALALHDAVSQCAPQLAPQLALKWPNDLLLGESKLAGILIEGANEPAFTVVIGLGVNCGSHPADTAFPATHLAAAGAVVPPDLIFSALTVAMARRLAQWRRGKDFPVIRADWLKHAAGLGLAIRVRLPERELAGRFEGLDEAGRLLLVQSPGGMITVTAGEVFEFGGR